MLSKSTDIHYLVGGSFVMAISSSVPETQHWHDGNNDSSWMDVRVGIDIKIAAISMTRWIVLEQL